LGTWATERLDALIAGKLAPPPVITQMELGTLDAWGEGWACKRWVAKPELLNADGSMFGGYLAALADQMMAFATMTVLPADHLFRTTNLSVSFFKVGRGDMDIEAKVISASRSMIALRATFTSLEGVLLAEASAQQILTPMARG
jgi:acyl-coenzyme A thioesterase PaaI-like protein